MSNSGRLARQSFLSKPNGTPRTNYSLPTNILSQITQHLNQDAEDAAYASLVTYAEALRGLEKGNTSWSIVKLYYSAFYSIRTLLLMSGVVPFHCDSYLMLDTQQNTFLKGGTSSHNWNWSTFRTIKRLNTWHFSDDSKHTYEALRTIREDANYRFSFVDPQFPNCIRSEIDDISKKFRGYRDDSTFFYTYLDGHYPLAYPTSLLFSLENYSAARPKLQDERLSHIKSIWPLKDRHPLTN